MKNSLTSEVFLAALELELLLEIFVANAIDSATLFSLESGDLQALGLEAADVDKILWGVANIPALNAWLEPLHSTEYLPAFSRNQIALSEISSLNDAQLREIGIDKIGHRERLLKHAPAQGFALPELISQLRTHVFDSPSEESAMKTDILPPVVEPDQRTMPDMQVTMIPDTKISAARILEGNEAEISTAAIEPSPSSAEGADAETAGEIPRLSIEEVQALQVPDPAARPTSDFPPPEEPASNLIPDSLPFAEADLIEPMPSQSESAAANSLSEESYEIIEALALKRSPLAMGALFFGLALLIVVTAFAFQSLNEPMSLDGVESFDPNASSNNVSNNTKPVASKAAKSTEALMIVPDSVRIQEVHGRARSCRWLIYDEDAKSWRTSTESMAKKASGYFTGPSGGQMPKSKRVCADYKDKKPNPGEIVAIKFLLKNKQARDLNQLTLRITSSHSCILLGPDDVLVQELSLLRAGATETVSGFRIRVGDECPIENPPTLMLSMSLKTPNPKGSAAQTWTDGFVLPLVARADGNSYCVFTGRCVPPEEDASVIMTALAQEARPTSAPKPVPKRIASRIKPRPKPSRSSKPKAASASKPAGRSISPMAVRRTVISQAPPKVAVQRPSQITNSGVKALHLQLRKKLQLRGLTFPDLRRIAASDVRNWGKWLRKKTKPSLREKQKCFAALVRAVSNVSIDHELLQSKLHRVQRSLDKVRPEKRGKAHGEIEDRYQILMQQLESVRTDSDRRLLARQLSVLELRAHQHRLKSK